jgi:hypothetical protein
MSSANVSYATPWPASRGARRSIRAASHVEGTTLSVRFGSLTRAAAYPPPASRSVDVVFSENAIICNLNLHGKMRGKDPELHFQIMKDSNYSVANVGISANMW